jgi:hypothetical protein
MGPGEVFDEKNCDRKYCDTVPLSCKLREVRVTIYRPYILYIITNCVSGATAVVRRILELSYHL